MHLDGLKEMNIDLIEIHKFLSGRYGLNSVLQAHIRNVHQNASRHVCDICAKVFKAKQQCQRHRLEHFTVDKPKVQCTMCEAW